MRRDVKILLGTLALGPVLVWGPEVSQAVSQMDTFRISDVEVRGIRFLSEDAVVEQLELGAFASVWGDRDAWRERLVEHPMVRDAEIRRRLPNGLRVTIEERRPIALAATPTLEPIDGEGYRLPIDPVRYSLDLPILTTGKLPPAGSYVFPREARDLAAELEYLAASDEEFVRRISTVGRHTGGGLVVSLTAPKVDLLVLPGTPLARLRQAEAAMADAMSKSGRVPAVIDIRFKDQVVVRHARDD